MFKSSSFGIIAILTIIVSSIFLISLPSKDLKEKKQEKAGKVAYKSNTLAATLWSDNFENGCTNDCVATTWNGWTQIDNDGGTTGSSPNVWFVSCAEVGNTPPSCGSSSCSSGDESLHIGYPANSGGDQGAAFNETGATNATYKTIVSPTISTVGFSNITLKFDFFAFGSAACADDRAQLRLSTDGGATWPVAYQYCLTSVCCGSCNGYDAGQWTLYTLALPAAFNNNPNIKIGFNWRNNGNGSGTDPSVAIDDIRLEVATDYSITTTSGAVVITDNNNLGETITVSENSGSIRFAVAGKTYDINGGASTNFDTTPADITISGKTSITINAAGGDDIVNIGAFSTSLPSLTVNGGTGNDNINFNGNVTFTANNNLDLDLQNDDASPGTDAITLATSANLILAGTGTATLRASKNITVNSSSVLRTANGALVAEANQQTTATTGNFTGINVTGGMIEATGTGNVTVKGKGGNASNAQRGINVSGGGKIMGGTSGTLTVDGRTQTTTGTNQNGVRVDGLNSKISSYGAAVIVNAKRN